MQKLTTEELMAWAASVGVGKHPEFPDSSSLALMLLPPTNHFRFWPVVDDPSGWPLFLGKLLEGLDEWSTLTVWPRRGFWPTLSEPLCRGEDVIRIIFQAADLSQGWTGAIRFEKKQIATIISVLFVFVTFNTWFDDPELIVVPDHGRQLLQTSRHDVVAVWCRDESRIAAFASYMEAAGYRLPTAPPDETFCEQPWMEK